jgi:transcriptional regulator with XRE-family HTH domain
MSETNLDEILEEYAAATPAGNDLKVLREVSDKYPQHAENLADFAAARAVVKHAPEEELSAEEEQRFSEAGLKNLRMVLGTLNKSGATANALDSLVDAAKAKGLNRKSFAAALGLSTSLVMYLEKRRLDFASIPKTIVAKIARILETGEELVSSYLSQPSDLTTNMSFKTNTRAEDLPPKNFSDAVREDQQLSAEEKRKLLELS